jgi:wyosine [tRNA(Phe)-imidazoG37] synthetase (radical SAM superfamily)
LVGVDLVISQIKEIVERNSDIDYITLSGSGEPTLNSDIGQIIRRIKGFTGIPVAVITNGSLLWREEVRRDISQADLVVPSVDAVSQQVFEKVNHPVEGLTCGKVLEGIRKFCSDYGGRVYIEVMLVKGVNDSEEEVGKINQFVRELRADRIQLNTVVRPPSQPDAKPLSEQELLGIKGLFDPSLPVEIIAGFDRTTSRAYQKDLEQAILELLARRPTRKEDMAVALGIHPHEMAKYLQVLEENKKIKQTVLVGKAYYVIA